MKILAIESSAVSAGVAVFDEQNLIAQSTFDCGLTHSRTLMPQVESLLEIAGLTPADMDLIAVANGPGSFTGVRIGVSCASGLALGTDKPAIGISTLEAMAWGASYHEGLVCPVMDARRNEVYTALFRVEKGRPTRLMADSAIPMAELAARLANYDEPVYLVGDGAELAYGQLTNTILAPTYLRRQRADGVALCALANYVHAAPARELKPVYLRLSQAEREKLEKRERTMEHE